MRGFSSKLALNQAILQKGCKIQEGEIVAVKEYSNCTGEYEIKYLLKKCIDCGDLFFQSAYAKHVYVRCEKCGKLKKPIFPNDYC